MMGLPEVRPRCHFCLYILRADVAPDLACVYRLIYRLDYKHGVSVFSTLR